MNDSSVLGYFTKVGHSLKLDQFPFGILEATFFAPPWVWCAGFV